jgi:1-deoxy-D-xylulose-5-phosphate synthase
MGGAGSAVNECLLSLKASPQVINLGIPDYFVEHALPDEMLASCGLDPDGILRAILEKVSDQSCNEAISLLKSAILSKPSKELT